MSVARPRSPSRHRSQQLAERARAMRLQPTSSERLLFAALRVGKLGVSFRRQVPLLGRYIADLYGPSVRLVVEIDGGYQADRREADAKRDRALARAGYRVLRIEAECVVTNLALAVERVRDAIRQAGF